MKRILTTIALAVISVFSFAQKGPVGMRMEISEVEQNEHQYSIFTYLDEDGKYGYYMSLGRVYRLIEVVRDGDTDFSLDHINETCLWMGETMDEAFAFLDSLLALLDEAPGTLADFPCRMTNGADKLTVQSTATCIVVKRVLQGTRLCFNFTTGRYTAEADVTKSSVKNLRWNLNMYHKLHPKQE